jgi:hypothetical protein
VDNLARQLSGRPIGVPKRIHSGLDLIFVKELSLAWWQSSQTQSEREQIQKLAISSLNFARVTAHGWSPPIGISRPE